MAPGQLWSAYIRYIGAGAVLASGLITLARTIPTIVSSARGSFKDLVGRRAPAAAQLRTERDIPMTVVLGGSLLLGIFLAVAPGLPTQGNVLAAVLILIFGFFFATVSSRITGLIGSSSNPISGMTIATLILTCLLFVGARLDRRRLLADRALRRRHRLHRRRQRRHHVAGPEDRLHRRRHAALPADRARSSACWPRRSIIGVTTLYMHQVFGIGSAAVPAPQATLMSTIITRPAEPEPAVGPGARRRVRRRSTLELCGIHSLSFAVGSYLPIATTAPIFAGGLVRWWVERKTGAAQESDVSAGTLFSSGLIAGGSIAGILFAVLVGTGTHRSRFQAIGAAVPVLSRRGPASASSPARCCSWRWR